MRIRKLNPDLLLLKWGMGGKRVWENDGSGWMDQVKHTHGGRGHLFEHQLKYK
jgi:hypothetical protein